MTIYVSAVQEVISPSFHHASLSALDYLRDVFRHVPRRRGVLVGVHDGPSPLLRHRPVSQRGRLAEPAEAHVGGVAAAEGRRRHAGGVHRAGAVREAGRMRDLARAEAAEGLEELVLLEGVAAGVPVRRRQVPRQARVLVDLAKMRNIKYPRWSEK